MTKIIELNDFIPSDMPDEAFKEVRHIYQLILPDVPIDRIEHFYIDILRLFQGEYQGYQKADTCYHDLNHTIDCYLTMARHIHGASVEKIDFTQNEVMLGLISALAHDTGYVQRLHEHEVTGACFTATHIQRGIEFIQEYFDQNGFSRSDFDFCSSCLRCTDINVKIPEITFQSRNHEILGKMLGASDLLGQMAGHYYLEKLPFLYKELKEGNIPGFKDLMDLLRKTEGYYQLTKKKIANDFEGVDRYLRFHFKARWSLDQDIYQETIDRTMEYLKFILDEYKEDYAPHLRRRDRGSF